MKIAPKPATEQARLVALRSYEILDTVAERGFDDLVALASNIFDVPIAWVSLIDEKRQWFKAKIGLEAHETGRDESFCSHAILSSQVMIVRDARADDRFWDNPMVVGPPYIRFYAGAPLVLPDGLVVGSLCLVDHKPGDLSSAQIVSLEALAKQVVDQILFRKASRDASRYRAKLERYTEDLEAEVRERTGELVRTRKEVVYCLARAAEFRDNDTGYHIRRVSQYVRVLAEQLGLSSQQCEMLELASTLHDLGKIGIPDSILLKPGKLTAAEYELMKTHAQLGSEIVVKFTDEEGAAVERHCETGAQIIGENDYHLLRLASRIALTHHEKYDGTGYPRGLAGDEIPLEGRITAVADAFDVLSSARAYKAALPLEECYEILHRDRGTHFDPVVVTAFFDRRDDIESIRRRWADPDETGSSAMGRAAGAAVRR